jgi:hypothetical protein
MSGDRDPAAEELPEQVDGDNEDPGGMPFDDAFPIEEIPVGAATASPTTRRSC